MDGRVRLQKLISRYGYASRRAAEQLVREGRVRVNGDLVREMGLRVPESSVIEIDGRVINRTIEKTYLMLNKPAGFLCSRRRESGKPLVYDLLAERYRRNGVFTVGRLDYLSEGLLFLTNDGDFAQKIIHPAGGLLKRYEALTAKKIPYKSIAAWINGVYIKGVRYSISDISPVDGKKVILSLTEGKNREIRKLFEHAGIPLQRLRRLSIGSLELGDLPPGCCRELTADEVRRLEEEAYNNKK